MTRLVALILFIVAGCGVIAVATWAASDVTRQAALAKAHRLVMLEFKAPSLGDGFRVP